jgi:HK97 family phage prohead protease
MTITDTMAPGYLLPGGLIAEWRSSGRVESVSKRTVTVVAVPYDEDADIVEPDGREYVESFDRKAFDGLQTRSGKVSVNRDHDVLRPIGVAVHLYPNRPKGLVAELRLTPNVAAADEALALAAEDLLGASISFGVPAGGVEWSQRGRHRKILKAMLDHIALTAVPTYAGATVLDVRQRSLAVSSATPRLDAIVAERRIAELGSRYNLDD